MTSLNSFPTELIRHIIDYIRDGSDLGNIRLVSRRFSDIATPAYFECVPLYAAWNPDDYETKDQPLWPNDVGYDAQNFKNILENERIRRLVTSVKVYTCNPDCNHDPDWQTGYNDQGIYLPRRDFTKSWKECFARIPEFENLCGVSIVFDRHGGSTDTDGYYCNDGEILQTRWARLDWMNKIFLLLGARIKHLSIRHFQETLEDEYSEYPGAGICNNDLMRESVLKGLESLRLSVVHETIVGQGGSTLKHGDSHECWAVLPSKWLSPASQSLKHLVLYSDLAVGWFPKLDLRGIHFPKLETLSLGHFIFSHDWQFDWIASHSATLRELCMDHCSILYQIGYETGHPNNPTLLDDEGYPMEVQGQFGHSLDSDGGTFRFVSYRTRWNEVFSRISRELRKLETFRFGISPQWDFHPGDRRDSYHGPGMPIMPWESEMDIKNDMFDARYVVYNDWVETYNVHWDDESEDGNNPWIDREWDSEMEASPDCKEEDMRAFRLLLGGLIIV